MIDHKKQGFSRQAKSPEPVFETGARTINAETEAEPLHGQREMQSAVIEPHELNTMVYDVILRNPLILKKNSLQTLLLLAKTLLFPFSSTPIFTFFTLFKMYCFTSTKFVSNTTILQCSKLLSTFLSLELYASFAFHLK